MKVAINSIQIWNRDLEIRFTEVMATKKFLGPERHCMEKKREVLKALGATPVLYKTGGESVRVGPMDFTESKNILKIGLLYFMLA